MDRVFPAIIVLSLGFSAPVAAQQDNPWLEPGRAATEIEACLAAAPEEDGNAARDCGDRYFMQCAEAGTWTTLAMNFCQYEIVEYWDGVVKAREMDIVSKEDQRLTDWVEASRAAYEAHRELTCSRFQIPMGTMYGPMLAACYAQMALERAEVLEDFTGDEPLIVPEAEE
ncbi:MAG: hypothetical protein LPK88_07255 [Alphaproteobacteria bacterium]|nr:hypothetical protein [Alphaproteobacteria bacterium]MDX5416102.1 hypothetical protein [Alphaproteobacteria bacterium]MDX5493403.1 hypothetical protein [Alphaproteobacteria bacterium]